MKTAILSALLLAFVGAGCAMFHDEGPLTDPFAEVTLLFES